MASFNGTAEEFKRYIGPYLRNVVQQIAKRHKAAISACQHCGTDGDLEAAHVHGRGRLDLIDRILAKHAHLGHLEVNISEFRAAFQQEHYPVEKAFLVLCVKCHRAYDQEKSKASSVQSPKYCPKHSESAVGTRGELLPISLDPAHPNEFKTRIMERREANVNIYYADGSVVSKIWNADKFRESSNLFGNLRSRPEFRKGTWQKNGIVKIHVRVCTP